MAALGFVAFLVWRSASEIPPFDFLSGRVWLGLMGGLARSMHLKTMMEWIPPLNGIAMCQNGDVSPSKEEGIPRGCYTDWDGLGQEGFHLHGAAEDGSVVLRKKLSRVQFEHFMKCHARCVVAMEACGGAHHWGRLIAGFGHAVRLVPPVYAKQYVKRHKNDAADAEAIAEAASRRHWKASDAAAILQPGLVSSQSNTRPAAKRGWGAFPKWGNATSEDC